MAITDVLGPILKEAGESGIVLRMTFHPQDFRDVAAMSPFASEPTLRVATQEASVAVRGHLWGIPVYVDPHNEQGMVYVVTATTDRRAKGLTFKLDGSDLIERRTAWVRLLQDDPFG